MCENVPPFVSDSTYSLDKFGFWVVYRRLHTPCPCASRLVKTVTKSTGRNDPETPLQKPRQRVQRRLEQRLARQNDMPLPLVAPVFPAGMEPLPPGMTEEDRANLLQAKKYQDYMAVGMESCLAKTTIAGVGGIPPLCLRLRYGSLIVSRVCNWWILLYDVFLLCVRGSPSQTKLEYHAKNKRDIQGDGAWYVEEW
jgi:hypothetical protein